jgi:hypothetical protein
MKRSSFFGIILILFSLLSCDHASHEEIVKIGWEKKNLCDQWTVQLPPGTSLNGIGCTNNLKSPGIIDFANDSIQIKFYAFGSSPDTQADCNFDEVVKWAKESCSENSCQGDGSITYTISPYIDYHSKTAGAIGKARDSSRYITTFEIRHCTNTQLTLRFESLSPYYDEMASEIIKSIEYIKLGDGK